MKYYLNDRKMFKFNFNAGDGSTNANDSWEKSYKVERSPIQWAESEEICLLNNDSHIYENIKRIRNEESGVEHYDSADILRELKAKHIDCSILRAERNHSDLIPGVYEGGLKVWECTIDLLNYITQNNLIFDNTHVLDLGCGAGLIGILASKHQASVYFQDYNIDVIKYITIPNVLLNTHSTPDPESHKFYSGDWDSFSKLLQTTCKTDEAKFDYIFTSETIYNTENYHKLHKVFERLLKKKGEIYLAAKEYYFGVGGGIIQFRDYINKCNIFNYEIVRECFTGVNRVILKITFKK